MANNFHKHRPMSMSFDGFVLATLLDNLLKNYSHNGVPATTVCAVTAHLPIVHVPPSSICARLHLISFLPTSGHLIAPT